MRILSEAVFLRKCRRINEEDFIISSVLAEVLKDL